MAALCACSSTTTSLSALELRPELATRAAAQQPLPFKVALSPITLAFDPGRINRNTELNAFSTPLDEEQFRREFVEMFEEARVFESVAALGRADERESRDYWLAEAWNRKADLLVEITVHRYLDSWEGRTGWFWPNIFIWGYTWVGSWFIPDEAYRSDVEVTLRYISVHSQREVYQHRFRAETVESLDDFERGWDLLGIFLVPGSLGPDQWRTINRNVMNRAMQQLKADLLTDAYDVMIPYARGTQGWQGADFQPLMAKKLALVIGIDRYRDSSIRRTIKFARLDAEAFSHHVLTALGGDFPERNVLLLANERATRENILDAVRGFLRERSMAPDDLLIYFAGYGATAPGPHGPANFLLPYDADLDHLADTALPLEELHAELSTIAARHKVLILDTSFWGAKPERGVVAVPRTSGWFFEEGGPPAGGPPPARRWGAGGEEAPPAAPPAGPSPAMPGGPRRWGAGETPAALPGEEAPPATSPAAPDGPRRWGAGETPAASPGEEAPPAAGPATPDGPRRWGADGAAAGPDADAGLPASPSDPWWGPPLAPEEIARERLRRSGGRGHLYALPEPDESVAAPAWAVNELPRVQSENTAVLMACSPGEGATEVEDIQAGTFTYYLLLGLEGQADLDKNRFITLDELYRFLYREVFEHSIRLDSIQHPRLYNEAKIEFAFRNPEFIVAQRR